MHQDEMGILVNSEEDSELLVLNEVRYRAVPIPLQLPERLGANETAKCILLCATVACISFALFGFIYLFFIMPNIPRN
jgi:hypothetical protein